MKNDPTARFSIHEVCQAAEISSIQVLEIVEHGILVPLGESPEEWVFDVTMLCLLKRASRLHFDLELDWPAIALILELLDDRDRLLNENSHLQQRLDRFLVLTN